MLDRLVEDARTRWGLDPVRGLQIVVAERLVATPIEPSVPLLVVPGSTIGSAAPQPPVPLPGRAGPAGRDPVAVLARLYPADHPVGPLDDGPALTVGELDAAVLERPLYLAPLPVEEAFAAPWGMPAISARLRQPDGCPWDREQTHVSLRNHLLEEAYEVYDAISDPATPDLADELGDLWLQVVLHAQLAAEEGVFDLADVQAAIASKIVRRHPHVFGEAEARTASDVNRQWERIKAAERAERAGRAGDGPAEAPRSALEGISRSLPALAASQEMQERAANIGYDWPSIEGVLAKVEEEVGELRAAEAPADRAEELGDVLFVLVNVARRLGVEAEAALRAANDKFRRRFAVVERLAGERNVALRDLSFDELDALWDSAKVETATKEPAR
ncbi:MAG TPA: nucleoside triphosphate pyrophosphohydrolase [Candidatus Limnocylindrales bacterium]|nr:nucleoside triphosphate pyrophosphohydrolase [Candidatus Limnocylindrales bacterium]